MANFTTRLKLKEPIGSEPFLRTDFEQNWGILDNFPGVQIVSSAGVRPTAAATGEGMLLYQVAEQYLVVNKGAAWRSLNQYAFTTSFTYGTNDSVPKGGTKSFPATPWQVTLPRAGGLAMFGSVRLGSQAGSAQTALYKIFVDGTDADLTIDDQSTVRFPDAGSGASGYLTVPFAIFGYRGGLAKGTHNIQVKVTAGGAPYTDAVAFSGTKIICFFTDS